MAWSATEAEVEATAIAFQDGLKLHAVVSELVDSKVQITAYGDNAGAIQLYLQRNDFTSKPCAHVTLLFG